MAVTAPTVPPALTKSSILNGRRMNRKIQCREVGKQAAPFRADGDARGSEKCREGGGFHPEEALPRDDARVDELGDGLIGMPFVERLRNDVRSESDRPAAENPKQ
jgi:hypothetical protein